MCRTFLNIQQHDCFHAAVMESKIEACAGITMHHSYFRTCDVDVGREDIFNLASCSFPLFLSLLHDEKGMMEAVQIMKVPSSLVQHLEPLSFWSHVRKKKKSVSRLGASSPDPDLTSSPFYYRTLGTQR